jgi:hypothetical protein
MAPDFHTCKTFSQSGVRPAAQVLPRTYPAIDSDPFFPNVRGKPEFAEIRSAAIACQNDFLAQRARHPQ